MKRSVVRYRVKPEHAEENQRLIEEVFAELAERGPDGIRYASYRLDDGVTFVHVAAEAEGQSIATLEAFGRFREGLRERCQDQPDVRTATPIGSYAAVAERVREAV
jgi:hypothetical protein